MPNHQKRAISAEDLYKFELISNVRISPEGDLVIYSLQRTSEKTEEKFSNLWIAPLDGGSPRQFTFGDQMDTSLCWSPDGRQIAFLSNRAEKEKPAQVYLISIDGGESRLLTEIEGKISELSWSPDGKHLLCLVLKKDPEEIEREKDEKKKKLGVVARHYKRLAYKLDGFGYLPKEHWHIWTINVQSGETSQLTDHEIYDEDNPTWSPDGKWIAFVSNRSSDPDFNPEEIDLFVIASTGGSFRKISAPVGDKSLPSFSPDGKWIAYIGKEGVGEWYKNQGLWIVSLDDPNAPPRNLTDKYDLNVDASTINDMGSPEMIPPTWSIDGQILYFQVVQNGRTQLRSISVDGNDLRTVIDGEGVVACFDFDLHQRKLAYLFSTFFEPGQVYICEMGGGTDQKITHHNRHLLDERDMGQLETVWIKGVAKNNLQGWILKPPGFDENKKYPSILEIHGGPLTQYGYNFMHEFLFLAAQGYVVHFSNPRGGRGYGEEHAKAIWGGWGGADFEDIMAWTDYVAHQPYIDTTRMGVTGGSYGGYMTVWIIGHTDRYKAAVTQRCVSNMISMWGSSDKNWHFQQTLNNKPPFEDLQKYWDCSPIKYIGNAKTPTLVIHSENDMRCPIEQGEQVFVALKRLGVDSEMVRFPGEFHGLSRNGRTDRRIVRLQHIQCWFDKYLQDD